ncbi:MAG TPA: dihydroneopterin aldolase [Bacteroidales bacterium]|nr:dihydroneopterin aldolase [Bacteroidales bacterium]
MALIEIKNMEFYAFHGHFKEEQIVGNKFLIDLTIEADLSKASETDRLEDTVDYQQAFRIVKEEMDKKSNLLENIGKRILDSIYAKLKGVKKATVRIRKMNPPVGGHINSVAVVMSR